jgi:hypothetical protein
MQRTRPSGRKNTRLTGRRSGLTLVRRVPFRLNWLLGSHVAVNGFRRLHGSASRRRLPLWQRVGKSKSSSRSDIARVGIA